MQDRYFEVVKSRDDKYILHFIEKGRSCHIGSKYSVARDVENFINSFGDINPEEIFIVFGLACGEHLLKMRDILGDNGKVIVFEPDRSIMEIFKTLDIAKIILNDPRYVINYYDEKKDIENILAPRIADYELASINFSYFANYDQVYPEKFLIFIEQLKDCIRKIHITKNTNLVFSEIWFDAFLRNIKVMNRGVSADELKDRYKNKPAIIVSAGPSLKKNIHLLKDAQEKFVIITGGRTLKALMAHGVEPHFVCVIDPVEKTYRLVEEALECTAPLVFYEGTNADVVEKYKGPKIYFTVNYFTGDFVQKTKVRLNYGGSVAHTCFGLAMHLGCNEVVFVGQDFAYTDDKVHADNAITKDEKNVVESGGYIYVDDIYGNKVKTDVSLDLFRKTMEGLLKGFPGKTYINATEGGANINGTKVMRLVDVLHERSSYEKITRYEYNPETKNDYEKVIKKMKDILSKLQKVKDDCNEGGRLAEGLDDALNFNDEKKLRRINKKLDRIDSGIKKFMEEAGFLNFILYPVTQLVMGGKEFMVSPNDSEKIKIKKIISRIKRLYNEMDKVLSVAINIMEKNLNY